MLTSLSGPMQGSNVGTLLNNLFLSLNLKLPDFLLVFRIKHHNTSPIRPLQTKRLFTLCAVFHMCVCNLAPETEVYEWSSETVGL